MVQPGHKTTHVLTHCFKLWVVDHGAATGSDHGRHEGAEGHLGRGVHGRSGHRRSVTDSDDTTKHGCDLSRLVEKCPHSVHALDFGSCG